MRPGDEREHRARRRAAQYCHWNRRTPVGVARGHLQHEGSSFTGGDRLATDDESGRCLRSAETQNQGKGGEGLSPRGQFRS